jgi:hypothetical protein
LGILVVVEMVDSVQVVMEADIIMAEEIKAWMEMEGDITDMVDVIITVAVI